MFQVPVILEMLPRILDNFPQHRTAIIGLAKSELSKPLADEVDDAAKEILAQRQANVAVVLARLGELRFSLAGPGISSPRLLRVRSYAIHRLRFGIDPLKLLERIDTEKEKSVLAGTHDDIRGIYRPEGGVH